MSYKINTKYTLDYLENEVVRYALVAVNNISFRNKILVRIPQKSDIICVKLLHLYLAFFETVTSFVNRLNSTAIAKQKFPDNLLLPSQMHDINKLYMVHNHTTYRDIQ